VKRWLPIIAAGVLAACTTFHPKPLEPPRVEEEFRARSLADPGLRTYLDAHLPARQPEWPLQRFDLQVLTLVAFYFHPDLDVARARVAVAEAGAVTAAGRPNPTLGLTPGYTDAPESPWLYGLTFDLPIETAGKRGYRLARAERLTEAARLQLAESAWQVRSRVRVALVEHLLVLRELDLLRAEEAVRSEALSLEEARLAVGEASRPDVDAARADLANARLALRAIEGRVGERRTALAAALGVPVGALDGTTSDWPQLDAPPAEDTLAPATIQRAGLLNRLDVRRALAEYAASEAALQLEVAKQYPDLHVGPGYKFDDGVSKFTVGISLTLPVLNQNQGPIAEAEAGREEAGARFLALQAEVIGETERALARYHGALAELGEADLLVVVLDEQLRATKLAVEVGEADPLALAAIRIKRLAAARTRVAAQRAMQGALGALEDAVERPLDAQLVVPEVPRIGARDIPRKEEER